MAGIGATAQPTNRAYPHRADRRSLGWRQAVVLFVCGALLVGGLTTHPAQTGDLLILVAQMLFLIAAGWRIVLILASRRVEADARAARDLPRYTVLVALLDEAEILPQLVQRLDALDYPRHRLQGLLLLEAHDHATIRAASECALPPWLSVLIVPPGGPRTKPTALNVGLGAATGDLLTVYDAEDDPDPMQLREAAARFAADRSGRLATLQAPLRIRPHGQSDSPFIDRQFAVEYAALFEVTLPAMALAVEGGGGGTGLYSRIADAVAAA